MRKPSFLILIPLFVFGCAFYSASVFGQGAISDHRPGVVWVKVKAEHRDVVKSIQANGRLHSDLFINKIEPIVRSLSTEKNRRTSRISPQQVDMSLYYEIHFDKNQPVMNFIDQLRATGYFEVAEPLSARIQPFTVPNDPMIGQQYYLNLIKAFDAWDIAKGDGNIVIAIVDTGGDLNHPDLNGNIYIDKNEPIDGIDNDSDGYIDNNRGWDFSGSDASLIVPGFLGDNNPSANNGGLLGHGTKVAGCAGATPGNGIGISGSGFHTKLLFTKHVADNAGPAENSFSSSPYLGVLYAATHGARVINCSWGGAGSPSIIEQDIIKHVTMDLGCLVIAAAGNSNSSVPIYPAAYDYVLSVAASNAGDLKHGNSSFGSTVDIIAPGAGILTTFFNDTYGSDQGTSLSAPIVAGAAALVWEKNPSFTPLQVAEQLRVSADESFYENNSAFNFLLGKGRLDMLSALTLKLPSIRAVNAKLTNSTGKLLAPGDSGTLSFDFINFLQPTKSLTVIASSLSPFVKINTVALALGTIQTMDTLTNLNNPFSVKLLEGASPTGDIDILLRFYDENYYDFQVITIRFPSYENSTENNLITSLASNGRIGFGDPISQTEGYGYIYSGHQLLNEGGIIMGTSAVDLHNNVRGVPGYTDNDFSMVSPPFKSTPGLKSSVEIDGSFKNALSNPSLQISYKSLVWKKDPASHYNDFIILEYKLKNISLSDISNLHFGIFTDFNISLQGSTDQALWDPVTRLGYISARENTGLPLAGVQVVKGIPNYHAMENNSEIDDGYSDTEKYVHISAGISSASAGTQFGSDVSQVIASGPHSIPAGSEVTIAFALHGANSLTSLLNSAKYADSVYNFTLTASKPIVSPIQSCYGKAAVISPQGASAYKWYHNFTGGNPIATTPTFTFPALTNDTTVFVSNASHTYESVRSEVQVQVYPNPKARFTSVVDGNSAVQFEDQSTNAVSRIWDFGDGNVSTEKDPDHEFTAGNYNVTLTVKSDQGCEDAKSETFLITGLTEESRNFFQVYPNPVQSDFLTIDILSPPSRNSSIKILNITGHVVREIKTVLSSTQIDFSSLPSGLYIVQFLRDGNVETFNVVKR